MELGEPITSIKGIGPRRAEALGKLGLFSLRDLLYFAPREYWDFSAETPICAAAHGALAALHVSLVSEPKHVHIRRGMEITTVRALGFGADPADKRRRSALCGTISRTVRAALRPGRNGMPPAGWTAAGARSL